MVTRETSLQFVFVAISIIAAIAINVLFPDVFGEPGGFAIGIIAIYGVGLGGAHLYLYLTGDGDEVPRSARARLLITIGTAFPLLAAGALLEGERIATVDVPMLLAILAGLLFVGYFVNEMRLGYTDFTDPVDSR